MQNFYDYKRFAIVYVDDEQLSLKGFLRAFRDRFWILTASNAQEGYRILEEYKDRIGLLLSDQQMPGEKGVQLLERARHLQPRILRFLVTAHADYDAAIEAVNAGAIYRYVSKPWNVNELDMSLRRALEFFIVQRERDNLLREKMSVLHKMMITDRVVSLGILAAGLGHHLRNSLVAVRTFLDLAPAKLQEENLDLEELRNPNFWRDFYDHVQGQVNRMTDMLFDLGQAADTFPPLFKDEICLSQFAGRIIDRMRERFEEKGITIEADIPDSLPSLRVDGGKMSRLFELLLMDQFINVPPGGRISLRARAVSLPGGLEPEVQLEIEDSGPGIPEQDLRSVFDPFYVRKDDPQEFGLKLMTCYFIVYHHGGRIEAQSGKGEGAKYLITLPTKPQLVSSREEDEQFITKVLLNEAMWEKLLAGN